MTTKTWSAVDVDDAEYVGILEFQDNKDEWHNFEVEATDDKLVFGNACNVGLLQSGYIDRNEGESLDDTLGELLADLETYYNDGPMYVSRIVCNDRM